MNNQQQPFEFVRKVTSTTSTTTEELFVALYNPNIPPPIGPTTVPLFPPPPQPQPPQPLALLNPPPTPPQPQFNQHVTVPHPPQPPQPQMNHHQHAAFSYPPHPPQPYHRAALPRHHQPPPCHHQATLEHAGPIDMTVGKIPSNSRPSPPTFAATAGSSLFSDSGAFAQNPIQIPSTCGSNLPEFTSAPIVSKIRKDTDVPSAAFSMNVSNQREIPSNSRPSPPTFAATAGSSLFSDSSVFARNPIQIPSTCGSNLPEFTLAPIVSKIRKDTDVPSAAFSMNVSNEREIPSTSGAKPSSAVSRKRNDRNFLDSDNPSAGSVVNKREMPWSLRSSAKTPLTTYVVSDSDDDDEVNEHRMKKGGAKSLPENLGHALSLSDEDSDDEARSVVTFKLKDYLDKRTTQKFVNGINRMCILGYFRCLEPEPRSIKKKCLPKLQGPEQDMVDAFNKILSSLPDHISQKINELHEEAKRFFEDY